MFFQFFISFIWKKCFINFNSYYLTIFNLNFNILLVSFGWFFIILFWFCLEIIIMRLHNKISFSSGLLYFIEFLSGFISYHILKIRIWWSRFKLQNIIYRMREFCFFKVFSISMQVNLFLSIIIFIHVLFKYTHLVMNFI